MLDVRQGTPAVRRYDVMEGRRTGQRLAGSHASEGSFEGIGRPPVRAASLEVPGAAQSMRAIYLLLSLE